jgi:hypothetical protein
VNIELNLPPPSSAPGSACREIRAHLSEYLDAEAETALCAQIEEHLHACPDCRVVFDTMQKTIVLYHAQLPEPMPDGARARLFETLHLHGTDDIHP